MTEKPAVIPAPPVLRGSIAQGPLDQGAYEAMKRKTKSWRDTLLLMFLRNTGFRPIEVARLEARHLSKDGAT